MQQTAATPPAKATEAGQSGPTRPERRNLLKNAIQGLLAAAALTLCYPLFRFLGFRVPAKPRLVEVPAPLPLSGVHIDHDFILFATAEGGRAVSRICTHLGCRVGYQQDKALIECPCHQSRFSPAGIRLSGPAEKNLPCFPVSLKKNDQGQISAYVVQL